MASIWFCLASRTRRVILDVSRISDSPRATGRGFLLRGGSADVFLDHFRRVTDQPRVESKPVDQSASLHSLNRVGAHAELSRDFGATQQSAGGLRGLGQEVGREDGSLPVGRGR